MKAMHGVTQEGTSTRIFMGAGYQSGGKTGTAQAVGVRQNEKYNASKLEEHRRDHSLYTAFAPIEAPTIALAVIVENAGFGATAAAPIARRVIDYALLGRYPSVEDIALTREGKSGPPVGVARVASTIPLPGNAPSVAVTGPVVPTAPVVIAPAPAVPASSASGTPR
jgi:penicillin-binding protein 2